MPHFQVAVWASFDAEDEASWKALASDLNKRSFLRWLLVTREGRQALRGRMGLPVTVWLSFDAGYFQAEVEGGKSLNFRPGMGARDEFLDWLELAFD